MIVFGEWALGAWLKVFLSGGMALIAAMTVQAQDYFQRQEDIFVLSNSTMTWSMANIAW